MSGVSFYRQLRTELAGLFASENEFAAHLRVEITNVLRERLRKKLLTIPLESLQPTALEAAKAQYSFANPIVSTPIEPEPVKPCVYETLFSQPVKKPSCVKARKAPAKKSSKAR